MNHAQRRFVASKKTIRKKMHDKRDLVEPKLVTLYDKFMYNTVISKICLGLLTLIITGLVLHGVVLFK